jgi:hypothetical protein
MSAAKNVDGFTYKDCSAKKEKTISYLAPFPYVYGLYTHTRILTEIRSHKPRVRKQK